MDALGHMNNASYFRYFEQARISWFDSLKIGYSPD
ncbi:MAG TPA: thioesterase family protein, partial [Burkholderiales bacterium]|nr:thioesterase family protein [Burkholderiales bacterium]